MDDESIPTTSKSEIEGLIRQIRASSLDPAARDKIERLLRTVLSLVLLLEKKNTSITKLKKLIFGKKSERHKSSKKSASDKTGGGETGPSEDPGTGEKALHLDCETKVKSKGHGHRPLSDYTGATIVECSNKDLRPGDSCPECIGKGRLYDLDEPTALLQFRSEPLINATIYRREVLRCSSCQQRYEAPLPPGVKYQTYDPTCDATIALLKYGYGLPWTRMSAMQEMRGVPMSESVMWERSAETARAGLGIFLHLQKLAANGSICNFDDTRVRILSCLAEDKKTKGAATQTTALVVRYEGKQIAIYRSGRTHAGSNLAGLLTKRAADIPEIILMCDALAANLSKVKSSRSGYCLVHARRELYDIREKYPAESTYVFNIIREIYRNEEEAVLMNPAERLAHHQEKSAPVMRVLREWIDRQLDEVRVEPNSDLGKALRYWRRHWDRLTLWLRDGEAPLDNNLAEQALRKVVLLRKNSLFFKTERGAEVGDILTSLIQTCRLNGVDAWEYLLTIIREEAEAVQYPERYLPWNYREERLVRAA